MKNENIQLMQPRMVRFPQPIWRALRQAAEAMTEREGRRVTAAEIIRRAIARELAEMERAA